MEDKEYNDIESLAAYLHSDKMQALKAETEASEGSSGKKPKPKKPVQSAASKTETSGKSSIDDILFDIENKRKVSGKKAASAEKSGNVKVNTAPEKQPAAKKAETADTVPKPAPAASASHKEDDVKTYAEKPKKAEKHP